MSKPYTESGRREHQADILIHNLSYEAAADRLKQAELKKSGTKVESEVLIRENGVPKHWGR